MDLPKTKIAPSKTCYPCTSINNKPIGRNFFLFSLTPTVPLSTVSLDTHHSSLSMDVKPDNQPTSGSPNSAPINFDLTPALTTTSTTFKKPCSHVGNAPAIIVSNPIFELIEPAKTQPLVPLPALPQHRNQHHPPHLTIKIKHPFTFGKSEKHQSSPTLHQLAIKPTIYWRKLSRATKLVVNLKGSEKLALEKF